MQHPPHKRPTDGATETRPSRLAKVLGRYAHDLNNMLSLIANYAHVIGEEHPGAREEAELILNTVQRGGQLTRELLTRNFDTLTTKPTS